MISYLNLYQKNKIIRISDNLKGNIIFLIIIALLGALFFYKVVLQGEVFYTGDNLTINLPSKLLFISYLTQGIAPFWNPYIFSGSPFLADINNGLLSPINILYTFISPFRALSITIGFEIIGMGLSMYWYSRVRKISQLGSLLSAIVYMFSGSVLTQMGNTAILNTIFWIVPLCISLERYAQNRKGEHALLSSVFLSLCLFGGHIQYWYYAALFSIAFIIFQKMEIVAKIRWLLILYIPFLILSAVQIVPFLEFAQYSTRPPHSLSFVGSESLVSYIRFILPLFFGNVKEGTSWGAVANITGYVGILPLFIVLYSLFFIKKREVYFFTLGAVISLLLSFGNQSVVYQAAFYLLPFFSRFRTPSAILIIYSMCMACLVGYSFDFLLNDQFRKKNQSSFVVFLAILTALIAVICMGLKNYGDTIFLNSIKGVNTLFYTAFFSRFLEYSPSRMHSIFSLWSDGIVMLLLNTSLFITFIWLAQKQKIVPPLQKYLFILIVCIDLSSIGSTLILTAPPDKLNLESRLVSSIKKDASAQRTLTLVDAGKKPPFGQPSYFIDEAYKAIQLLYPTINSVFGVESIAGYGSIIRKDYADYFSQSKSSVTSLDFSKVLLSQLNELGVTHIIATRKLDTELYASNSLKSIVSYFDSQLHRTVTLYKNSTAFRRAYLVNSSNKKISNATTHIISSSPNRVEVAVSTPVSGRLILTDMYYPGWTVWVDGKSAILSPYKKIMRSTEVGVGNHLILYLFTPYSIIFFSFISGCSWIGVLSYLLYSYSRKSHEKRVIIR